jgi:hypothetical protein
MKHSVFVVGGSSGSGKTSTVNSVRGRTDTTVPLRYVTRESRVSDNARWTENKQLADEEFAAMYSQGLIEHAWERFLGEESGTVRYGFAPIGEITSQVIVYSANNDFFRSESGQSLFAEGAFPIIVHAVRAERTRRLAIRSPELRESEVIKRLGDEPHDLFDIPGAVVISNPYSERVGNVLPCGNVFNQLVNKVLSDGLQVGQVAIENGEVIIC